MNEGEVKDIELSIIKSQAKARELVKKVLEADERCRNNDLWMVLSAWREQGVKIYLDYNLLDQMFTPETLTRVRRDIQNSNGLFLPTDPNVLVHRSIKEETIRKSYSNNNRLLLEFQTLKYSVD